MSGWIMWTEAILRNEHTIDEQNCSDAFSEETCEDM